MAKPRAKKVKLSKSLHGAIAQYFALKAANGGMFKDSETKQKALRDIDAAAPQFTVTIYPGVIELVDAKGRVAIITASSFGKIMLFKRDWSLDEAFAQKPIGVAAPA